MDIGTIGFVGLNHLGIVSAITTAFKGHSVWGYDSNESLINDLQNKRFPFYEPDLENLYEEVKYSIDWTIYPEILKECKLIFITIDTPTNEQNESNYDLIFSYLDLITNHISHETVIVISSQVYPGFTRSLLGQYHNPIFYQPEFLVVGNAMELSCNPIQVTVGCEDKNEPLPVVYKEYLSNFETYETQMIRKVSYESAEMAKIATNIYLAAQVSTTNVLAEVCEKVKSDWREVKSIIENDSRIGSYINPGLGISGGHLERDMYTIEKLSEHIEFDLLYRKDWVNNLIHLYGQNLTVAIWGLTYKPNTNSMKNSQALHTLGYLKTLTGIKIKTYDPYNIVTWQPCHSCNSPEEASHNADILCILTADKQYSELSLENLTEHMKGGIIIDPYGMLNHEECIEMGFKHFQLGVPNE